MIETASHLGLVSDDGGKFAADNPEQFKTAFKPYAGRRVWVTIEEWKELHSSNQRAYWFGVVVKKFMDAMGETDSYYVHKTVLIGIGHCEEKVNKLTGETTKEALRTRRSSKVEYSARIEAAQRLGAENDIHIPDPNTPEAQAMVTAYKRTRKDGEA